MALFCLAMRQVAVCMPAYKNRHLPNAFIEPTGEMFQSNIFEQRTGVKMPVFVIYQGVCRQKKGECVMQKECMDGFCMKFHSYDSMLDYHKNQSSKSVWMRKKVNDLYVAALDRASALAGSLSLFAPGTSEDAVEDTVSNVGLAMQIDGEYYPVRTTAYKSLLERAKISGTALPKLKREDLAQVLNACLRLFQSEALLLLRDEKVSAVHSGDESDYSILPVNELMGVLQEKLNIRFAGNVFTEGYADHSLTSASWEMPEQKEDLLGAYTKVLEEHGNRAMASKLMPGIRFSTSDTGISSAKVSALLMGVQHPIHIGGCISVDHRNRAKVSDFENELDQLFAQFGDSVEKLTKLIDIQLEYPVNAMTCICKKLSLPKKAAVEAIAMFDMANGNSPATAHDVFMAMQEIPFILKSQGTPQSKMLTVEENMARALTLKWGDYDLAKGVNW